MTDIPIPSDFPVIVRVPVDQPAWMKTLQSMSTWDPLTMFPSLNSTNSRNCSHSSQALMDWTHGEPKAWLDDKDLLAARDYWDTLRYDGGFYMEIGFKDKGIAALFKLTFGGQ